MDDPEQDGTAVFHMPGLTRPNLTYYFRLLRGGEVIATLRDEDPFVVPGEGAGPPVGRGAAPTAGSLAEPVVGTVSGTSRSWSGQVLNHARR